MNKILYAVSSCILCLSLTSCSNEMAQRSKESYLSKMSEEKIQEKTRVVNKPWIDTILISQKGLYTNGIVYTEMKDNRTEVWVNSFLGSMINRKTGATNYFIGADLRIGTNVYQHIEYTVNGEKKYVNIENLMSQTNCGDEHVYTVGSVSDISRDCLSSTKDAAFVTTDLINYIASLDQPFHIDFISDDPTIRPYDDVIMPVEARAILDRAQQEKATLTAPPEATPDVQPR